MLLKVALQHEVKPGSRASVTHEGQTVIVFNVDGGFYATLGSCPHAGGPLEEGQVQGKVLTCPWHDWTFDVTTGQSLSDAPACVQALDVVVEGDDVLVTIPEPVTLSNEKG